jgi:hypothetical protein
MRNFVKAAVLVGLMLFVGAPGAPGVKAAQLEVGINIGRPPAVRVERETRSPGTGYVWLAGYWYPAANNKYAWHAGYWTRPPYEGASWVAPRHDGKQYYAGYWQGDRGRTEHNHASDRDKNNRDYRDDHR